MRVTVLCAAAHSSTDTSRRTPPAARRSRRPRDRGIVTGVAMLGSLARMSVVCLHTQSARRRLVGCDGPADGKLGAVRRFDERSDNLVFALGVIVRGLRHDAVAHGGGAGRRGRRHRPRPSAHPGRAANPRSSACRHLRDVPTPASIHQAAQRMADNGGRFELVRLDIGIEGIERGLDHGALRVALQRARRQSPPPARHARGSAPEAG